MSDLYNGIHKTLAEFMDATQDIEPIYQLEQAKYTRKAMYGVLLLTHNISHLLSPTEYKDLLACYQANYKTLENLIEQLTTGIKS